jgi:hypothetical protein
MRQGAYPVAATRLALTVTKRWPNPRERCLSVAWCRMVPYQDRTPTKQSNVSQSNTYQWVELLIERNTEAARAFFLRASTPAARTNILPCLCIPVPLLLDRFNARPSFQRSRFTAGTFCNWVVKPRSRPGPLFLHAPSVQQPFGAGFKIPLGSRSQVWLLPSLSHHE